MLFIFQCFETESELRLQGKPKTPDVLLMVPLALKLPCSPRQAAMRKVGKGVQDSSEATEYDVSIVHWIDSKGTVLSFVIMSFLRTQYLIWICMQRCLVTRLHVKIKWSNCRAMSIGIIFLVFAEPM